MDLKLHQTAHSVSVCTVLKAEEKSINKILV